MNCVQCGAQLLTNAKFCSRCGTPVNTTSFGYESSATSSLTADPSVQKTDIVIETKAPAAPVAVASAPIPREQGAVVKRKSKAKTTLTVVMVLVVFFAVLSGYFIYVLSPVSDMKVSEISLKDYLTDYNNYETSGQFTLTLGEDLINSMLFDAYREKNLPYELIGLRYNPSKETLTVATKAAGIFKLGINISAEPDIHIDDGQLIFSLSSKSITFGRGKLKLSLFRGTLPDDFFDARIVLPGLGGQVCPESVDYRSSEAVVSLRPDTEALIREFRQLEPYKDYEYMLISERHFPSAGDARAMYSFRNTELTDYLLQYRDEGVRRFFDTFRLAELCAGDTFITQLNNIKLADYDRYRARIEQYACEVMDSYSFSDCIKLNGRLYGSLSPDSVYSLNMDIGTHPPGLDTSMMTLIYDAEMRLAGISYAYSPDSVLVVYEDRSSRTYPVAEYNRIYFMETEPKGRIRTPMPSEDERIPIQRGIREFSGLGEDELYYVRYIRCDDKYAVAVVSPVDDKQNIQHFCLQKNASSEWSVIRRIYSSRDYHAIFAEPEYRDFNLGLIPLNGLDGYSQYTIYDEEIEDLLSYFEWYGYDGMFPRLGSGKYCPLEIITDIDGMVYIRFVSENCEAFLFNSRNPWDWVAVDSYPYLLQQLESRGLPLFLGLQV